MQYVYVFFQPGSAGHFFTRCLNLIDDDCYIWVDRDNPRLYQTVDQKMQLFEYSRSRQYSNWVDYEKSAVRYYDLMSHTEVRPGSTVIYTCHPDYRALGNNVVGYRDTSFVYYIDPVGMTEWAMMNAFYKDSYVDPFWMQQGQLMRRDNKIQKILLKDIVKSSESCFRLVNQIATQLHRKIEPANHTAILKLWHQWQTTVLQPNQFEEFRQTLGLDK